MGGGGVVQLTTVDHPTGQTIFDSSAWVSSVHADAAILATTTSCQGQALAWRRGQVPWVCADHLL